MIASLLRRILAFAVVTSTVSAHVVEQFYLSVEETGSEWRLDVTFDASYAFEELRDDPNSPQPESSWLVSMNEAQYEELRGGAEKFLRQAISFHHDGRETPFTISFPDFDSTPPRFPQLSAGGAYVTIRLEGTIPAWQGGELNLTVSPDIRPNFILAKKTEGEIHLEVVSPGGSKPIFFLDRGRLALLWLGFRHVVPDGFDHILFILALFLMARKWRPLLAQSLAFTIAHSLSLGLVVFRAITIETLPGSTLIEPLIALSIAALAIENLFRKELHTRRLVVVFLFGLIHGLGFAGSLGAVLQNEPRLFSSLVLANVGVELAQISVLAAAWLATMRWWQSASYQKTRMASSLVIATIGVYWTIERLTI